MQLGPLMIDLQGPELDPVERDMLQHPLVGGIILFSRNYESLEQISELVRTIHDLRAPGLLVAVDHEGGPVQRFQDGFTTLPACAQLGETFDNDNAAGLHLAEQAGWLMAAELRAVDIDFSFAPVLDLGLGISEVIGARAFHGEPQTVAHLARAYLAGMRSAGMASVGKHFPGHGSVGADSHHAIPVDERTLETLMAHDVIPFKSMIEGELTAIMPAHVIYPRIDSRPAGFSPVWLQTILRQRLNFDGVIFSDDINMAGATVAGDHLARTEAALAAGCDMVLICNAPSDTVTVIDQLQVTMTSLAQTRLAKMRGGKAANLHDLKKLEYWRHACHEMHRLCGQNDNA